jgi:hypothetical protein
MKPLRILAVLILSLSNSQALDVDADGMSDVFEQLYGVSDPALDPDGDGRNNADESAAGTNPFSGSSVFQSRYAPGATAGFWRLDWQSVVGKNYGIRISDTLTSWASLPIPPLVGTGAMMSAEYGYTLSPPTGKTFYQMFTLPSPDLDGDGLDAWEEFTLGLSDSLVDDDGDLIPSVIEVINGTNPLLATSPASPAAFLALGNEPDAFEVFPPGN